jgi:hypothetical protein
VPRRYRRRVSIGLAVGVPLMLGYALAYGATHPLHAGDYSANGGKVWRFDPGKLKRYDLYLEDLGPFAVSDVSVVGVEGSPPLQLERVRGLDDAYRPGPSGSDRAITLELRQSRVCPPGVARLDAVWVRYTLLDGRHEQRIPLRDPPRVSCP